MIGKKATTKQLGQFTEDINQNDWNVLAEGPNNSDKLKLLYKLLEDKAEKIFHEKVTITKKKVIPKDVKKLFNEKMKISKRMMITKSNPKLIKLKKKIEEIEIYSKKRRENI